MPNGVILNDYRLSQALKIVFCSCRPKKLFAESSNISEWHNLIAFYFEFCVYFLKFRNSWDDLGYPFIDYNSEVPSAARLAVRNAVPSAARLAVRNAVPSDARLAVHSALSSAARLAICNAVPSVARLAVYNALISSARLAVCKFLWEKPRLRTNCD